MLSSHLVPDVDRDESKLESRVDYQELEAAGGLEMLSSLATLSGEGEVLTPWKCWIRDGLQFTHSQLRR